MKLNNSLRTTWQPAYDIAEARSQQQLAVSSHLWCIQTQWCSNIIGHHVTRHSQGKSCHIVIHILHTKSTHRQALVTFTPHPHCTSKLALGISNFYSQNLDKPRLSYHLELIQKETLWCGYSNNRWWGIQQNR